MVYMDFQMSKIEFECFSNAIPIGIAIQIAHVLLTDFKFCHSYRILANYLNYLQYNYFYKIKIS